MAESSHSEPPPRVRPDRPTVIYVMGAGHSGSTILGVALGNCEDFVFTGELDRWLPRSGVPQFGGSERARFWSTVSDQVDGAADLFGDEARRCIERSSSLFRLGSWRARRRLRKRYRRVTEDLLRAIARASGATHIVDTSHFPLRARELQALGGIDLFLVLLIRDPRSVVASYTKPVNRHAVAERRVRILTKNADLWLTYLLSVFVFLCQPRDRRLFLRHEDFVADPEGVLRDVLDRVGSRAAIPDLTSLEIGFPIQGNRLLWSETVALKREPVSPVRGSRVTGLLQLPWSPVFARLKPAARASGSRVNASTSESR